MSRPWSSRNQNVVRFTPVGQDGACLRLPSVFLYLAGLLGFASAARMIAGDRAFLPALWLGVLWPFAFHFGRVADWYSTSFFLVAALTLAYLRYLERRSWQRLAGFAIVAVLLVYSTYYGWAIVACLAIDIAVVRRDRDAGKFLLATFGTLALAYIPLWRIFAQQLLRVPGVGAPDALAPPSQALNSIYNLYTLFVSESVAPWFWWVSVPVGAAIATSIVLAWSLLPLNGRRFLVYFALLFAGLAVLGIINTKRLLFISGWLLLAFAVALANSAKPVQRRLLVGALGFVAAVGWGGVVARQYYAAPHFIEPWAAVADEAAKVVEAGGAVITNSPALLFSMNYSLHELGLVGSSAVPGWVEHPAVFRVVDWAPSDLAGRSVVLLARGVNANLGEETDRAEKWLADRCVLRSVRQLVPDSGYELKARFFPAAGQQPYRIALRKYDCSRVGSEL